LGIWNIASVVGEREKDRQERNRGEKSKEKQKMWENRRKTRMKEMQHGKNKYGNKQ
jgi:hypothetical protein